MRTTVQIVRDMALMKAQLKEQPQLLADLLAPLQKELEATIQFTKNQTELPLSKDAKK